MGLLLITSHKFSPELWPLIYATISFPLNILRTNCQNFTKFYKYIHIDKVSFGIVTHNFLHICTRVMTLDLLQNFDITQYLEKKFKEFHQIDGIRVMALDLRQNVVSAQYLEKKLTEVQQIL